MAFIAFVALVDMVFVAVFAWMAFIELHLFALSHLIFASTCSSSLLQLLHRAKNLSVSSIVALFIAFIAMADTDDS